MLIQFQSKVTHLLKHGLLQHANVPTSGKTADVGCGTGSLGVPLAMRVAVVSASDISGSMAEATMGRPGVCITNGNLRHWSGVHGVWGPEGRTPLEVIYGSNGARVPPLCSKKLSHGPPFGPPFLEENKIKVQICRGKVEGVYTRYVHMPPPLNSSARSTTSPL